MSTCQRCRMRGKTWQGDNPSCAFPNYESQRGLAEFCADNWNCATMNALRGLAERPNGAREYSEDEKAALLPDDGAFLVLGWYKSRGRTQFAAMLSGETMNPLLYQDAVRILTRAEPARSDASPAQKSEPPSPTGDAE